MGKYQFHISEHNGKYLCFIANELAEANRLERLKMGNFMTFNVLNLPPDEALPLQFTKEELEDQA